MIIGITGKAGAGKNMVGRLISDAITEMCGQYSFALKVKEMYDCLFGEFYIDSQSYKSGLVKGFGFTPRHALQGIGNGLRDSIHPDLWVNILMKSIDQDMIWNDYSAIITDVRYPNEVEAIKKRGGVVVRVVRPNNPTLSMDHISETALDEYDFPVIMNNGTVEDLKRNVEQFLKTLNL